MCLPELSTHRPSTLVHDARARSTVAGVTTISVPEASAVSLLTDLPDGVEVLVWDGLTPPPPGAEAIEFFVGRYDAPPPAREVLERLERLRVVQVSSAGVGPWVAALPDGVTLHSGRGIHTASTAELAVLGMLACLRDLPGYLRAQGRHDWHRIDFDGLDGRRVLVIGAGDIGARIAAAVRLFDAEATLVGRTAREGVRAISDLPELLAVHDVVVLAVPHTPDTHHLVDAQFLAALPNGAVVVNIARGAVVDTDALMVELHRGRVRAFLDVTDPEPLPADHPLWDAPNLILTPHIGGGTSGWRARAYRLVSEQVGRYVRGEQLLNRVADGF